MYSLCINSQQTEACFRRAATKLTTRSDLLVSHQFAGLLRKKSCELIASHNQSEVHHISPFNHPLGLPKLADGPLKASQ